MTQALKHNLERIHQEALHILEEVGITFHHEGVLSILEDHGVKVDGKDGPVRRPAIDGLGFPGAEELSHVCAQFRP